MAASCLTCTVPARNGTHTRSRISSWAGETMTTTPHVLLDRYEVGPLLGAGGMAEVYEGRDRLLARRVAIKVPLPQYAHDPAFQQRFRREAQAAASLSNPGVVAVYDTGMQDRTPFIVMEFVEGRTLKEAILAEGPLYPARAAEIAADVCSALAAAHARGLVHRDVKPPNVMLAPGGRVKLMDLGIARADAAETATQTGVQTTMLGTALYLSPEQAQGQPVDARSDLYSLGCCLYEMLTGTVPFRGATPVAILYRHVREAPVPPRHLNPDVPPALEAICLKALAKRPEDRYQTAVEMREDLERARAGVQVQAGRPGAATAAMATTVLPPLGGYPGPGAGPTTAPGRPVVPDRARRHAAPAAAPARRRRWLAWLLVPLAVAGLTAGTAFVASKLVDTPPPSAAPTTIPVQTTQLPPPTTLIDTTTTEGLPTTAAPTTAPPTTQEPTTTQPQQVQVPDVIGREPQEARRILEEAGLRVRERRVPVNDPQQDGRVVLQQPQAGATVRPGRVVTIFVGFRAGGD
jgi:tRNA A-37 threonylcarbamoyl transferase component Bud32